MPFYVRASRSNGEITHKKLSFFLQIAGCGLMGFGVYTRTNDSRVSRFSSILGSYLYSTLSLALIASGGIVILLSFLGCCGAIKEVRCMLGSVRRQGDCWIRGCVSFSWLRLRSAIRPSPTIGSAPTGTQCSGPMKSRAYRI